MNDNLVFEKVWEDGELIEFSIYAVSKYITAQQNYYTTKTKLIHLYDSIAHFLDDRSNTFTWDSGNNCAGETAHIVLTFNHMDVQGHVEIEMHMEIDDTASKEEYHQCSFCVKSEIGMVDKLLRHIGSLIS